MGPIVTLTGRLHKLSKLLEIKTLSLNLSAFYSDPFLYSRTGVTDVLARFECADVILLILAPSALPLARGTRHAS